MTGCIVTEWEVMALSTLTCIDFGWLHSVNSARRQTGCIHCQEWPHIIKLFSITHALLSPSHPSLTPTWRLPRPRKVVHTPWCTGPKWLRRTSIQGKDVVRSKWNMSQVVIVRKGWPVYWSIGRLLTWRYSLSFYSESEYQCWYWAKLLKLCLFMYICTYEMCMQCIGACIWRYEMCMQCIGAYIWACLS